MNGASSAGVAIAKQYDRDTKIAYVEQIRTGKLREIKAARELGVYKGFIYGGRSAQKMWKILFQTVGT
jgi:hypothetical protein